MSFDPFPGPTMLKSLDDLNILDVGNKIQLTGAIYSDDTTDYLFYFPGEQDHARLTSILEMNIEEWERFVRQTDLLETEVLMRDKDGKIAKALLRKSTRMIEQEVSWKVFRRDNYACRYCGTTTAPLTVDHLVLWEKGGPSIEANLISACKKCNRVRGNMEYADWLKSESFKARSKNLSAAVREENEKLLASLSSIPIRVHQRSR